MANDANAPIAAIAIRSDNIRFLTMYSPGLLRTPHSEEWKPSCECNQAQARGGSLISRIRRGTARRGGLDAKVRELTIIALVCCFSLGLAWAYDADLFAMFFAAAAAIAGVEAVRRSL